MHFVVIQGRGTRPSQKNIWNMQNMQLDSPCNPSPPVIFKPNGNTKKVIWMVCWTFLVGEHLVLSIVLCRKFRPKWSPMKNPSGAMETEGFLLCKDGWFSFQTIFFLQNSALWDPERTPNAWKFKFKGSMGDGAFCSCDDICSFTYPSHGFFFKE